MHLHPDLELLLEDGRFDRPEADELDLRGLEVARNRGCSPSGQGNASTDSRKYPHDCSTLPEPPRPFKVLLD